MYGDNSDEDEERRKGGKSEQRLREEIENKRREKNEGFAFFLSSHYYQGHFKDTTCSLKLILKLMYLTSQFNGNTYTLAHSLNPISQSPHNVMQIQVMSFS